MRKLEKYEPTRVFYYFEEITKIPRCSFNEDHIATWLVDFAKGHELDYTRDEYNNVIIRKPGSKGYESAPVLILQGHMDMVCEKNENCEIDFKKDPIDFEIEDGKIISKETTLGADNGIALAMAMAILESDDIPHPPLEVLITSNEENGMTGASNLNGNLLTGKILLNLDSETEGVACVSCAGGRRDIIRIKKEYKSISENKAFYELSISGLKGGHSGQEIQKGLGNSNKLLARALLYLRDYIDLIDVDGGAKANAIPRYSRSVIAIDPKDTIEIQKKIISLNRNFVKELGKVDPDVRLNFEIAKKQEKALTDEVKDKIIQAIVILPDGVQSMSHDIEGLVSSSTNVGVIESDENEFRIISNIRSSITSLKEEISTRNEEIAKLVKADYMISSDYPAWEYKDNSYIRTIAEKTYKEFTGENLKLEAIHAGLECGIFKETIGDIDMLSIGPNISGPHAPGENIDINSVKRVYEFVKEILKNLN